MCETIVKGVKAFISLKFKKVQQFKHHDKHLCKKGIAYNISTFIFNEVSRLQYNLSIGCSTIWRKYGIIIGKLRMFIFVAMEMQKLYYVPSFFTGSKEEMVLSMNNFFKGTYTPFEGQSSVMQVKC